MAQKPDFVRLRQDEQFFTGTAATLQSLLDNEKQQEEGIRSAIRILKKVKADEMLAGVSTQELTGAKAGIRISALTDAGYRTLGQLSAAQDWQLQQIPGVGEKQVAAIRAVLNTFRDNYSKNTVIAIDPSERIPAADALVLALDRYMATQKVYRTLKPDSKQLLDFIAEIIPNIQIRSGFAWVFSGREKKERTAWAFESMEQVRASALMQNIQTDLKNFHAAIGRTQREAEDNFRTGSASFYALLEKFGENKAERNVIYNSIPEQLAHEIDQEELNLEHLNVMLREYQSFGAKYALHQEKVLLGDEMGLGKTVQALAVMSHLYGGKEHFLVVCPASVLVNWCREINTKSDIPSYLLHGKFVTEAFETWREKGGAAVTNFETVRKIVDEIDGKMALELLVIDEAHYIKNPDAQRTKMLRRLTDESAHILMMTGTALENKVEEMCALIDFVQPEIARKVRGVALGSNAKVFRTMAAPVYLRRVREDVLQELPPITEEDQWLEASAEDIMAYQQQVRARNFMQMRRISFLGNGAASVKLTRLLELVNEAKESGRKVVVFSYFRETISMVGQALGSDCIGSITGSTPAGYRQQLVDEFAKREDAWVLVCQISAGGTGLNIQAASIVIFCEPQIKPSLEMQALSRVYRMGQVNHVAVYHLLCEDTVDEAIKDILARKQQIFDEYADESTMAEAADGLIDTRWIAAYIEKEHEKLLPAVIS